jgi:hypothetical protein
MWDTTGKTFCFVGYDRRKLVQHPEIVLWCIPHQRKTSSVATPENNLFRCIPEQIKISSWYPTPENKLEN